RKIILAAALTAALTLGAAPAFAVGGTTNIKVTTDATAISVTVPTSFTVTGPAEGGNLTGVPAKTVHKITNLSTYPIYVSDIKAEKQGGWELASSPLTSATTSVAGVTGDIYMKLTPDGATGTVDPWVLKAVGSAPKGWTVAGKSVGAASGVDLQIAVEGSISPVKKVVATDPAVNVVYTVAPGTAPATP
ncbi:MAG: hypothetical protein RR204_00795, partial [Raoultibacter sp.]